MDWVYGTVLVSMLAISTYLYQNSNNSVVRLPSNVLLITAHPDDECMFFSPTILNLRRQGILVNLLCLSNGNADGLGQVREKELRESARILGIQDVSCLNNRYVVVIFKKM